MILGRLSRPLRSRLAWTRVALTIAVLVLAARASTPSLAAGELIFEVSTALPCLAEADLRSSLASQLDREDMQLDVRIELLPARGAVLMRVHRGRSVHSERRLEGLPKNCRDRRFVVAVALAVALDDVLSAPPSADSDGGSRTPDTPTPAPDESPDRARAADGSAAPAEGDRDDEGAPISSADPRVPATAPSGMPNTPDRSQSRASAQPAAPRPRSASEPLARERPPRNRRIKRVRAKARAPSERSEPILKRFSLTLAATMGWRSLPATAWGGEAEMRIHWRRSFVGVSIGGLAHPPMDLDPGTSMAWRLEFGTHVCRQWRLLHKPSFELVLPTCLRVVQGLFRYRARGLRDAITHSKYAIGVGLGGGLQLGFRGSWGLFIDGRVHGYLDQYVFSVETHRGLIEVGRTHWLGVNAVMGVVWTF